VKITEPKFAKGAFGEIHGGIYIKNEEKIVVK
jgi:hypothetical protein